MLTVSMNFKFLFPYIKLNKRTETPFGASEEILFSFPTKFMLTSCKNLCIVELILFGFGFQWKWNLSQFEDKR